MTARTIWKFTLEITDEQRIQVPAGAKLLTAQIQQQTVYEPAEGRMGSWEQPCLWAEVTLATKPDYVWRTIFIYGTGNTMPDDPGVYVATFQRGPLVWHVYDGGESRTDSGRSAEGSPE